MEQKEEEGKEESEEEKRGDRCNGGEKGKGETQESGKKSEEEREKWVNCYTLEFSIIHYLSEVQQWLHWKC